MEIEEGHKWGDGGVFAKIETIRIFITLQQTYNPQELFLDNFPISICTNLFQQIYDHFTRQKLRNLQDFCKRPARARHLVLLNFSRK